MRSSTLTSAKPNGGGEERFETVSGNETRKNEERNGPEEELGEKSFRSQGMGITGQ